MSRARDFADLAGSADAGGLTGKNVIINGNFQVWQRSTSQTASGVKSADRWYLNLSGGTATASQGTFTDGQTAVPGNPQFYMALNVTTGNDNCGWQYRIEGTHEFANDVYTLTFWAKSATPRQMTVSSQSHDSSADVTQNNTVSPATFTPTSSWQKFTFKVTHSSMNTLGSFASGDYTRLIINQGSDTSTAAWKLDLAQVQLEKGEQATPFEHRSYGDELARCQRYFEETKLVAAGTVTSAMGDGHTWHYKATKRAAPTITKGTTTQTGSYTGGLTSNSNTIHALGHSFNTNGSSAGIVTAEVTADAEL